MVLESTLNAPLAILLPLTSKPGAIQCNAVVKCLRHFSAIIVQLFLKYVGLRKEIYNPSIYNTLLQQYINTEVKRAIKVSSK